MDNERIFTKEEGEYNLKELRIRNNFSTKSDESNHKFALKMASLICLSIIGAILILSIFFGEKTPLTIGVSIGVAGIIGLISFMTTRNACLM